MSKTEQKKLKGIVSISSDDYFAMNNQKTENQTNNNNKNNNNQKPNISSTDTTKKIVKKKPISKPTPSSKSSSKNIQLPDNFFEQILECEFKIKEKFDPKTFYELINLYSSAINFYESMKDPKFITYNQSLNLLFSMPEAKKFMEGKKSLTKKEKKNDIEKRMLQSEKRITRERVKRIYLSKKNVGKNIISEEFNKQRDIFRKRKEEKRQKYLLSTSALPRQKKKDNLDESDDNIKNENKSFDLINPKDENDSISNDLENDENFEKAQKIYKTSVKKSNPINLITYSGDNNILDELKKEDLKNEINKISISGNDSDKNNLDDSLSFTNSDNLLINLSKMQRITNKTLFQEKLKSYFDDYISEFSNIFFEKNLNSIIKDYTESGNLIEKKLIEFSIESYNQIKQMEYLRDGNDNEGDETYNDQIESMIQQIQDEEEESKFKVIKEGEQREKILNDKYIYSIDNFQCHKLDMLREKLKLDITTAVNSIVLK